MSIHDKEQWLEDYIEFSQVQSKEVPQPLFKALRSRLFPAPWLVFAKLAGLHAVVGFFSLAICNQFGLNPFQTDQSLTDWFMKMAGHDFCMLLCGTFFVSSTYLLSNLVLTLEELEVLRRRKWLQTVLIGLISLAAFYLFGAELIAMFVALWIIGALIGGILSIEGSYRLRKGLA